MDVPLLLVDSILIQRSFKLGQINLTLFFLAVTHGSYFYLDLLKKGGVIFHDAIELNEDE